MNADLATLIGLVRQMNDCYPNDTDAVNEPAPALGVYLDAVPQLSLTRLANQEKTNFWARLVAARLDAALDLKSDLLAFLSSRFPARPGFSGQVGGNSYTQFPNTNAELVLATQAVEGASINVPSIGLLLSNASPTQAVTVRRDGESDPLFSVVLNVAARSASQHRLPQTWQLPCDGSQYVFSSLLAAGTQAGDNRISCGCGNSMNTLLPYAPILTTGRAGGFILTLQTACSAEPLLAVLMQDSRINLVLAWMLAYRTAYRLQVTNSSGQVERATVLSTDDLSANAAICDTEYQNRLSWLRANCPALDVTGTCLTNRPAFGWSRGGINTGY